MSTLAEIVRWIHSYEMKLGKQPKIIPISEPEMVEITNDFVRESNWRDGKSFGYDLGDGKNQLLGIDTELSPWAEMTRQRILEIGAERICMEQTFDMGMFSMNQSRDPFTGILHQQLTASILADTTHLNVSFDWDHFAWLKRRVEWIGRKWPVKRKTVRIEGKVLYPYLKIQAPADTHRVKFMVTP